MTGVSKTLSGSSILSSPANNRGKWRVFCVFVSIVNTETNTIQKMKSGSTDTLRNVFVLLLFLYSGSSILSSPANNRGKWRVFCVFVSIVNTETNTIQKMKSGSTDTLRNVFVLLLFLYV